MRPVALIAASVLVVLIAADFFAWVGTGLQEMDA